jgi:hypothetical protein
VECLGAEVDPDPPVIGEPSEFGFDSLRDARSCSFSSKPEPDREPVGEEISPLKVDGVVEADCPMEGDCEPVCGREL